MSTITTHDEALLAGAEYVRHVLCGEVCALADMTMGDGIDVLEKLVCEPCERQEHGSGYGFVAVRPPSIEGEFPALFESFAKQPDALIDYGHLLGLKAPERALIAAILRHQSRRGSAHPSEELLARESGLSERSVKRWIGSLAERDLLSITHRHDHRGRQTANRYDLRPLWRRLGEVAASTEGQPGPPQRTNEQRTGGRAPEAKSARTGGQNCTSPEANLAPEVERSEGERSEGDSVLTDGSETSSLAPSKSTTEGIEETPSVAHYDANVNGAGEDELADGLPAAFEPVTVGVELGQVAAVQPASELRDQARVVEAVVGAGSGDSLGATSGATGTAGFDGGGIGHEPDVRGPDGPVLIGGLCPDPQRCEHWKRYANGPWTCAANHPRADGSAPEGRAR